MAIPGACPPLFVPKREREIDRNAPTEGIELVVNSVAKAALWALSYCSPTKEGLLLLCKINLYRTFPNTDQKSENEKSEKALARFALITSLFFGLIGAYQKKGGLIAPATGIFFGAGGQYFFESKKNKPPFDYKGLDRFPIERFKRPALPEVLKESCRKDLLSTFQREIGRYAESREGDQIPKALEEFYYLEIPRDVCGTDRDSQNEKDAQEAFRSAYAILIEKSNQADWSADGIPTALAIGKPNSESALSQDFLCIFPRNTIGTTQLTIHSGSTPLSSLADFLSSLERNFDEISVTISADFKDTSENKYEQLTQVFSKRNVTSITVTALGKDPESINALIAATLKTSIETRDHKPTIHFINFEANDALKPLITFP